MCGIVGYLAMTNAKPLPLTTLWAMSDAIAHRGPDGEGFYFSGEKAEQYREQTKVMRPEAKLPKIGTERTLGLAHRRLSIIDLSKKAAQPMICNATGIVVVFNGEIYNHLEIRRMLSSLDVKFKTNHSDTETLLEAYKFWGRDCLLKLRGMFAFAIWDPQKDLLWLARDRTGIKPLYFSFFNGRFYFASEIKAMLKSKDVQPKIYLRGLYDYLSFMTVPAPYTLFDGIFKLPAGCEMEIRKGVASPYRQYWDVYDNVKMLTISENEIAEQLAEQIEESILAHGLSDVPVGVFLSGGIDSSTNAALFARSSEYPVKAFTIGYRQDQGITYSTNEFEYARLVAQGINCEHHIIELDKAKVLKGLNKIITQVDDAVADLASIPIHYVSQSAIESGIKVIQAGEGPDELFMGYTQWPQKIRLQQTANLPATGLLERSAMGWLKLAGKQHKVYYEWLRRANAKQPIFWGVGEAFYEAQKQQMLSPEVLQQLKGYNSWEAVRPHWQKYKESTPEDEPLNWMSYIELKMRLPELLLSRMDKMTMAASLEARVPFLDHRFVEFAMSIPAKVKFGKGNLKHILKKSVRGIIPDAIIDRKKQGFAAPAFELFHEDEIRATIQEFNRETQLFSPEQVLEVLKPGMVRKSWYLYNLALWWKAYIK